MDGCGRRPRTATHLDREGRLRQNGPHGGDAARAAAGCHGDTRVGHGAVAPIRPVGEAGEAALTRVNKRGVRWALRRVRCPVELAAQAATSQVQEVREPHIGTVAGTEPTVTIHWRRRSR